MPIRRATSFPRRLAPPGLVAFIFNRLQKLFRRAHERAAVIMINMSSQDLPVLYQTRPLSHRLFNTCHVGWNP